MRCETVIKKFFELDAHQRLSMSIRLHLLFCRRCRSEIARIQKFLQSLHDTFPFDMPEDISQRIMDEINATGITYHRYVSTWHWTVVSFLMLAGVLLMSYSEATSWLESYFGSMLAVPLHLVMGLLLSSYIGVFIGINLQNVKEIIGRQEKWRKLGYCLISPRRRQAEG